MDKYNTINKRVCSPSFAKRTSLALVLILSCKDGRITHCPTSTGKITLLHHLASQQFEQFRDCQGLYAEDVVKIIRISLTDYMKAMKKEQDILVKFSGWKELYFFLESKYQSTLHFEKISKMHEGIYYLPNRYISSTQDCQYLLSSSFHAR